MLHLSYIGKVFDGLDERTVGLVVLRFGNPVPLNYYHANFFSFEMDPPVIDDATGKPVNQFQKPLKFMEELVNLYSAPGDWILDGLGGTGKFCIL